MYHPVPAINQFEVLESVRVDGAIGRDNLFSSANRIVYRFRVIWGLMLPNSSVRPFLPIDPITQLSTHMTQNPDRIRCKQGRSILLIGSAIWGEKVHTWRISKETKVLPPEQEGGKENFCFFHPWLTQNGPQNGHLGVNHGISWSHSLQWKNKSFPSLPPSQGGELLFILKSIQYALFHSRWRGPGVFWPQTTIGRAGAVAAQRRLCDPSIVWIDDSIISIPRSPFLLPLPLTLFSGSYPKPTSSYLWNISKRSVAEGRWCGLFIDPTIFSSLW